jgi:EAL domain-containing protein (putative c-di-GMP-specific phosphodiesterase class I)
LARWHHPVKGLVQPADFIPVAEDSGLIVPLGEWVLTEACRKAVQWPNELKIAVNLSPVQLSDPRLLATIERILAETGLAAHRLELEITERIFMEHSEVTLSSLGRLKDLGVGISMDDFGTGYSSLSYLRSFPFDKIKIDGSFVRDLSSNADSMAIIRAVTGLGSSLGISTTAEGVETQEELAYLKTEGCTEAQGYYFSEPKPANEVHKMLAAQMGRPKAVA